MGRSTPMLKLVASGTSREAARLAGMVDALDNTPILGLTTSLLPGS